MDPATPSQSPPRPVKVTYSRKQNSKRKRDLSKDSQTRSAQDSDISQSDDEPAEKPSSPSKSPSNSKKMSDMRPPTSTVPVASRSSGPSKRARTDIDASETASVKSSKKGHVRGSSSVASLKHVTSSAPSSAKKPVSVRGHKPASSISQQQIAASESDFDDGASIADSMISSNRVRRTEAERIEYFKNQPECGSLEANRAMCLRCHKYVALGKQTSYNVRPWEKHRAKCDLRPAVEHQASPEGDEEARLESKVTQRTKRTEDERKSVLLADPNAQEVKTDQVLCKRCYSWIRLQTSGGVRSYDLYNWNQHSKKCGAQIPSSRVATAQRKLELVNDSQVKSFGVHHVLCAACDNKVELMNDVDYNLTLWKEHKTGCSEFNSKSNKSDKSSSPRAAKAPTSVGSTSTVVSPEGPVSKGVKRRLEDTEIDLPPDDPDARPQNRPRTEEYVAPNKEPPSVFGWFMMPFKSFVRGFKESMNRDALASGS